MIPLQTNCIMVAIVLASLPTLSVAEAPMGPERIAALRRAAASGKPIERRRAARALLTLGTDARQIITDLARTDDVVIRRAALRRAHEILGSEAEPILRPALADPAPLVRQVAVEELVSLRPRTDTVTRLLMEATQDDDAGVRKIAASAFWAFHRDVVPLRKRPGWDHTIEVLASLPLPETGWRFRTDASRSGHVGEWFRPRLEDGDWCDIQTGAFWHDAAPEKVGHYLGVGWYRTTVTFPAEPEGTINEVVLHFGAVDESTWLWVNGHYAGTHDLGPSGWRTPFDIDITPFVKWNEPNQITVRVLNTAGAGGIYEAVELQVLK